MARTLGCRDKSQCPVGHHKDQTMTYLEHPSIRKNSPKHSWRDKGNRSYTLGINGTPTLGSECPGCHQQAGTSAQSHSLEPSQRLLNNTSSAAVGKPQENTGNNLSPCSFVQHATFFCTSMLIKLLAVPLPPRSFPFPE